MEIFFCFWLCEATAYKDCEYFKLQFFMAERPGWRTGWSLASTVIWEKQAMAVTLSAQESIVDFSAQESVVDLSAHDHL